MNAFVIEEVDYQKLGLQRNPFPSVPMYSDYGGEFFSKAYDEEESKTLRKIIKKICLSKSSKMAIYVLGEGGVGKSTFFRNFVHNFSSNGIFLPIYCRFPFYGGLTSLYHEVVRRIEPTLLTNLAIMTKTEHPWWPPSYFLRKVHIASTFQTAWETIEALKISAPYSVEAFQDLVSNLQRASRRERVVLFLDDLEHTWLRLTGVQKFRWEQMLVRIIPALKRKLILVLPVNSTVLASCSYPSRPYFGMYNWSGIDLDHYIKFEPKVTVLMKKKDEDIRALISELINSVVENEKGKQFCQQLVDKLPKPIASTTEAFQRLYFETRKSAQETMAVGVKT